MKQLCRLSWLWSGVVALAAAAGGCQDQSRSATRPSATTFPVTIPDGVVMVRPDRPDDDPAPGVTRSSVDPQSGTVATATQVLSMDAYVISVPDGTVSRSNPFWKRIDEQGGMLRTGGHDLLRRNGVRIGLGRLDEWSYFKQIIDEHPATTQIYSLVSLGGRSVELEMKKDVAVQNIWYYNDAGRLIGRTYENCQNLWSVGFASVPRHPDHVRVGVSPLVRSLRKRLEVVMRRARPEDPPEREILYRSPEYLFDLAVEADVPPGRFLVVAPSEEATAGTLGEAFLMTAGLGQRVERVILMVPRTIEATARPAAR